MRGVPLAEKLDMPAGLVCCPSEAVRRNLQLPGFSGVAY